jgi:predicted nucleic-acid-binding Zn-ribbon protein
MRSFSNILSAAILTGLIIVTYSCTPGACFDDITAYMKASLFLDSTEKQVAPDSLSLMGAGRETTKIYDAKTNLKQALIPLDASSANSSFLIGINGVYDTLTVWYSTFLHLISKDCGYTFYYNLDSLLTTNHKINRITITKNSVTTLSEENIRIYY